MSDFRVLDVSRHVDVGTDTSTSKGTVLTTGAANTKGSWVQLIASTAGPIAGFIPTFYSFDAQYLVDIGIGAGGSEQILVADLPFLGNFTGQVGPTIPLQIPAGSRIAARAQSPSGSSLPQLALQTFDAGLPGMAGFQRAVTYGADTATSKGTTVTNPTNPHVKGTWVQFSASTTNPIRTLIAVFENWITNPNYMIDIGVGAAAAEQVVVPNLLCVVSGQSSFAFSLPISIPAGSRLAVRAQDSVGSSKTFTGILIGLD